jgi:hypothetical protein
LIGLLEFSMLNERVVEQPPELVLKDFLGAPLLKLSLFPVLLPPAEILKAPSEE